MSQSNTIAIIGGGFSGSMVAIHLLKQATYPLTIKFIEPRPPVDVGVAYSTPWECHLLNVPAGKMSAFADEPDHFWHWLQHLRPTIEKDAFVPRQLYGRYIRFLLAQAQAKARAGVKLEWFSEEAIAIKPNSKQLEVCLKSGEVIAANKVVLALGNFTPGYPDGTVSPFYESQRYFTSWDILPILGALNPKMSVLLLGSGLTMMDIAVALHHQRHQGKIYVVSRRGLLPQPHQSGRQSLQQGEPPFGFASCLMSGNPRQFPYVGEPANGTALPTALVSAQRAASTSSEPQPTSSYGDFLHNIQPPTSIGTLMRLVRQEIASAKTRGYDWRCILNALRPHTQTLWQSLPLAEKRRFLRHVRPYWEIHRHLAVPQIDQTLKTLIETQQLKLYAGRVQKYQQDGKNINVFVRPRGKKELIQLPAGIVINCTGPECDYRALKQPIILNLLASGLVRPDPLHLGLDVASNGALINATGKLSDQLYTLGPTQKGCLWETTAIREIRQQAQQLAQVLIMD